MKVSNIIRLTLAALAFSMANYATASQEVSRVASSQLMEVGVVSAGEAHTLDELNSKLAMKADAVNASSYRIISASGNNLLHGTAILYR
ncbi:YdgH/BhsA/McbA-like domain containing protein [Rouxiella sp. Mn2063]|uniref:YdgH/BhsA/McbA-like domain containing protein n=1 Tax=Rouxiella sp. Mn2063 TaxID=3395262 RepID=UPI003BCCAEC0